MPQASAVWSADPRQMWTFPARFLAEFFDHHGMLGLRDRPRWRTIRGGSALRRGADRAVHGSAAASTPVASVARGPDHVLVRPRGGEAERFDEVMLATHSDQALGLLEDATDASESFSARSRISATRQCSTRTCGLLPRRRRAWASWNYHLSPSRRTRDRDLPHEPPTVAARRARVLRDAESHDGDRPGEGDPDDRLRPSGVHGRRRRGAAALREISGRRGTDFCGAYWGWGFHEDGVQAPRGWPAAPVDATR